MHRIASNTGRKRPRCSPPNMARVHITRALRSDTTEPDAGQKRLLYRLYRLYTPVGRASAGAASSVVAIPRPAPPPLNALNQHRPSPFQSQTVRLRATTITGASSAIVDAPVRGPGRLPFSPVVRFLALPFHPYSPFSIESILPRPCSVRGARATAAVGSQERRPRDLRAPRSFNVDVSRYLESMGLDKPVLITDS